LTFSNPAFRRWMWYATETDDCVPLDPTAYAATVFDDMTVPLPDWVCRAPDGGLHRNATLRQLDIDIAELPSQRDEISWTCDFTVRLIAHSWLEDIRDLIDEERIGLGMVRINRQAVFGWSTIHERHPPTLLGTEGHTKSCPVCGASYTVLHGREYFSDPAVVGRPLIANNEGLFIREDIVLDRRLRTPRGAFEPGLVEFEPEL
jgi:hypothetical protein